ncbi:hypothetical protein BX600DRAFT_410242 [Xylariales sp. PMI_506]|nr:hypothetical protein BX600DRAFT_410242 [Xylariales sp. PMI_506]
MPSPDNMRIVDYLPDLGSPAIYSSSPEEYITHHQLRRYVENFRLPSRSQSKKDVVAVALPNGPLLAATVIAVANYYTAAPITPSVGVEQFKADVLQAGATIVLTTFEDVQKLRLGDQWVTAAGIQVFLAGMGPNMEISVTDCSGTAFSSVPPPLANQPHETCIQLFTSGTSGNKKLVPISTGAAVSGAHMVITSWGLNPRETCLNMMPLHHVGGLIRNVFAPIFAGGSTICCAAFNPTLFWDLVDKSLPTWYYASPTMHSLILEEGVRRQADMSKSRIRLICNAAGGLLPALAIQLRDTFHCTVLPSYGMTECMPISTPPLDYRLDREGTSGISVGPELSILNGSGQKVAPHTIGRISVRGAPLFSGYLRPDGSLDTSAFNEDGWFDTGDLGYMDEDGYLYITGRSKEVINRGGEIISPFEVENAIVSAAADPKSPIYERVTGALAFGLDHDVLQEVVAIVLVTPKNSARVDLRTLHLSLKSSLQQAKWPTLIVYMDDVPKRNNKILRTNLAKRLKLPEQTGSTPFLEKHWEAVCPPVDTPLSEPIPAATCALEIVKLQDITNASIPSQLQAYVHISPQDGRPEMFVAPRGGARIVKDVGAAICGRLKDVLPAKVHNYNIPERIQYLEQSFPMCGCGSVDKVALRALVDEETNRANSAQAATLEDAVVAIMAQVLSRAPSEIDPRADFFTIGGDSILAGRLLSMLRTEFKVAVPIEFVFNQGSAREIAGYLEKEGAKLDEGEETSTIDEKDMYASDEKQYSSTNPFLLLLQLVPMVILYPMRRAFQWTVFLVTLSSTLDWSINDSPIGRLIILMLSIAMSKVVIGLVAPWLGILAKWIIIGRYKAGHYPMWGPYHTRWWMVQKIVDVCGMGHFGMTTWSKHMYYRLMGAKIGRNVTITGVKTGEWDLIEVKDGAILENCTCRPFAAERNTTMYLGKITVGRNAVVCRSSIIPAGCTVPDGTCIGPNSSAWELEDADESFRDLPSSKIPGVHWALNIFGTVPVSFLGFVISMIPWALGLLGLVMTQPVDTHYPVRSIVRWFASGGRVGFHYLALVLRTTLGPFFVFGFAAFVRWFLDIWCGKLKPGPAMTRSQVERWRTALIKTIMPPSRLHEMTEILGQHYEGTSTAYRMMGAKVGKRVYWPGTGPSVGDYHLLDVGNDVVFGSRSHIVNSDGISSEPIKIGDNAMIADRVCLLPGVTIGKGAVMGSGSLTRRNKTYEDESTWVGSRGGDAVSLARPRRKPQQQQQQQLESPKLSVKDEKAPHMRQRLVSYDTGISTASTAVAAAPPEARMSPFGRAFYQKKAPYRVWGSWLIFFYSALITAFVAAYWNAAFISAIQFIFVIGFDSHLGGTFWHDALITWAYMIVFISIITTVLGVFALQIVIIAKWIIIGRRLPGNYDWDKSSYCQRWQLFMAIERIRRRCYRGHGVLGMLTGTHWIVVYFRALGATIGRDCALFASGPPSLIFTEPDLVTLGDRVAVDDASLVGHINSRGTFDLNELHVGNRRLMEHTLVMGGDVVDARTTLQGWPARVFKYDTTGRS